MNIRRIIDQNKKLIMYVSFIIIFLFLVIKTLDTFYEESAQKKLENIKENNTINKDDSFITSENIDKVIAQEDDVNVNVNSIENIMNQFIKGCNEKEIEKAYMLLTDECKNAMYKTKEEFESKYVKNVFNEKKEYSMTIWDDAENMKTYQVKLVGDILATGGEGNISQEFYTFIKTGDTYKININNYIYGKNVNKEYQKNGVTIKIKNINVYNTYEEYELSFTNNTPKEICLTGNKYVKNIYLKNSRGTTFSSLDSKFDNEEITLTPGNTKKYTIKFNKVYNSQNKVTKLVLSDVILNYEEYINTTNKDEYKNRTSVEIDF